MHFSLWASVRQPHGAHAEISYEQFRDFVAEPAQAETKDQLEGWSPVRCTNNHRALANVELASLLVLDDDASALPTDALVLRWGDLAGLVHTSHSHTPAHPKHRICLRLSRDVTAPEYARLWEWASARAASQKQVLDRQARDASRFWFVPAVKEGGEYKWAELAGAVIDVDKILAGIEGATPDVAARAGTPVSSEPAPPGASNRRTAMAMALGSAWPAKGRHAAQLALAGALRGEGFTEDETVEFLCTVCRAAGDEDRPKRVATVRHTYSRPADAPLTGWTRLKGYVDPVVVDAARGAVGRDAEWTARVDQRMAEAARFAENSYSKGSQTSKSVSDSLTQPDCPQNADSAPAAPSGPITFEIGGFNAELPPINYQIDSLIARGDVVMFVAHGNSLKTWLTFSMAYSIASGRPWLAKYPVTRGRAAIVDFESGKYEVLRRLKLLGVKDEAVGDRLLRASYPAAKFSDPETWVGLASAGLEFLVIDSYNAAAPELDENDARAALMLQYAGRFAEATGCTVVFVHHSRKGSGGDRREAVRGSTALFAACDRIFEFADLEKQENGVVLSTMKSVKDGAGRAPSDVRVELSDQGIRRVEPAKGEGDKSKETNRERIMRILAPHSTGIPKAQLFDQLEGRGTIRRRDIAEACSVDLIREYTQKGGSGRSTVFVEIHPLARRV